MPPRTVRTPVELNLADLLVALARTPSEEELAALRQEARVRAGWVCPCGQDRVELNGKWLCMQHGDGALFRKGYAKVEDKVEEECDDPVCEALVLAPFENEVTGLYVELLGDDGAADVAQALTHGTVSLTSLTLANAGIGERGATALAEALISRRTLKHLDLTSNQRMGAAGGAALAADALHPDSAITSLSLYDTGLGPDGGRAVAKSLCGNEKLTHLDLSSNAIGPNACKELAAALDDAWGAGAAYLDARDRNRRASLEMSPDAEAPAEGSSSFKKRLKVPMLCLSLTRLEIGNNGVGVGEAGCAAIGAMLKHNASLTHLALFSNRINYAGAKPLLEGVMPNTTLISLDIQDNPIGERGARDVAAMLRSNTTLSSLMITGREVGEGGVTAIGFALSETNRTLRRLDLSSWLPRADQSWKLEDSRPRKFGERGSKALAAVIKHNAGLLHVNVEGNQCGNAGARALIEALEQNRTLLSLGGLCDENELSDETKELVEAALQRHREVVKRPV